MILPVVYVTHFTIRKKHPKGISSHIINGLLTYGEVEANTLA